MKMRCTFKHVFYLLFASYLVVTGVRTLSSESVRDYSHYYRRMPGLKVKGKSRPIEPRDKGLAWAKIVVGGFGSVLLVISMFVPPKEP